MTTSTKAKSTPNYSAWRFVDERKEFNGSSMHAETYALGSAPHMTSDSWMNEYETTQYNSHRAHVTYIVWSFYTPIAYYVGSGKGGWYKVGQSFSSFTGRHVNGALRNVPGHDVTVTGTRGNWTVTCTQCKTTRNFTRRLAADHVIWNHR